MKKFMDENFLLSTETAQKLFHNYAENTPILDYHCHINPREIAEDRHFDNITQVWLGGDHYKWRFMRSCGVEEYYITGAASDKEKFFKWAEVLGKAIGNPLYHWSHLELQRYFDYHGALNKNTAEEVWNICNAKLASPEMSARNIIKNPMLHLFVPPTTPSIPWSGTILSPMIKALMFRCFPHGALTRPWASRRLIIPHTLTSYPLSAQLKLILLTG